MKNEFNRSQLLHLIDMVCFAADDIQLYLDTHPEDREAIQYFNNVIKLRNQALQDYATNFGPLTIDTAAPTRRWNWIDEPWPWEGGCR